jgi:hypothetical protein
MQAVYALECYRLKENLGFYDSILCLSSELVQAHADNFNEYALTLGK